MGKHFVEGLVTETIASFFDDGSVDYDTTGDLFTFQVEKGANGLFVNGLGDEAFSLSLEERANIVKVAVGRCQNTPVKVIAGVMVNWSGEGLKLIEMYEKTGCDAICIAAPPFFECTEDALFEYFSTLIGSTRLPVYLYNCREMGTLVSPRLLGKLARTFHNLRGYKDATRNTVHLLQCMMEVANDDFDFLCGCDGSFFMHMMVGGCGTVSFLAVPFPTEVKDIYTYYKQGEIEKSKAAQEKVLKLRSALQNSPNSAAYMYAQKYTGGPFARNTRLPMAMIAMEEEEMAKLDRIAKELEIG